MEGYIRCVADDPTVVWHRRDVEELPYRQFHNRPILKCCYRSAGDNEADMFDAAKSTTGDRGHVFGPFPARLVAGAADCETTDVNDLESTLFE